MTVECGVFMIGVLIQITTFESWVQFAIGRLVSGFGVGSLSAAVPMYQAETAPPQIRGTLTATYQYVSLQYLCVMRCSLDCLDRLFITFGILIACE